MDGKNNQILNWKIENLSCWNQALHGKCIESSLTSLGPYIVEMKLYPKGTSGQEELMVVHISITNRKKEFSGELSFIGADGSTLCTQRVQSEVESNIELPPGLKFEKVTVQSGGNESDRKDGLILRLKSKINYRYDEHHVCTIIQVFDVTMEVDRSVILKENKNISYIRYTHGDYDTDLYLKTGEIREDKKIELYLDTDTDNDQFLVKTYLSLISSEGSLLRYENNEHLFPGEESRWKFSDSLSKGELSEIIRLILNLKIISGEVIHTLRNVYVYFDGVKIISNRYISECMENIHNENKTENAIAHNDQENAVGVLSKELMCLYQDQDFSDLQLKCESVSFPVHRNILSARSTVFKTMLSSHMTEAATGCVDITDLEAPTLARFLAFLYTGAIEDLQGESALKLYYAADKYNVPSLKRECVSFLSANVCVSNVCDVLSLGDKHQDDELTAAAHNFILKNFKEVLKSKEWKSFMCSEPLLAVKTVTDFAEKDFF